MKFFKPEDFQLNNYGAEGAANIANAKLRNEGKIVYNYNGPLYSWFQEGTKDSYEHAHFKGLLINVEELKKCDHPVEDCRPSGTDLYRAWVCDNCHSFVKPLTFG
jgi:hypothetical protein